MVGANRAPTSNPFRAILRDVLAGTICSVLSTAYCLSYAALIFSGLLANWLSYGIAVTFLSAASLPPSLHCAARFRSPLPGRILLHPL